MRWFIKSAKPIYTIVFKRGDFMNIPKYLYSDVVNIRRSFCSKRGYIEDITQKDNMHCCGQRIVYAVFTHNKTLIGTCGYESGVDRFMQYSDMVDLLTNEHINYDETTDRISMSLSEV